MAMKAANEQEEGMTALPAFDFNRFAAASGYGSGVAANPLIAHPAAAMAAATAIGFGLTTQMAGAFFGALQGAMAASQQFAAALERRAQADEEPSSSHAARVGENAVAGTAAEQVPPKKKPEASVARKARAVVKKADDLKGISGIGPKLETVLNEMGICRFADIAAWSEEDVRRIDNELGFGGRILRDDWVGQAKALGKGGSVKK